MGDSKFTTASVSRWMFNCSPSTKFKKRNSIEDISGKSFLSELSLKARKEVTELLINKGWLLAEKKGGTH